MATACGHTNKPHYSNGLCQNCYLAQYYQKRKAKQQQKALEQKALKEGKSPAELQESFKTPKVEQKGKIKSEKAEPQEPISADKNEDETIGNFISFTMDEPKAA